MSDGAALRNQGTGWKPWKRVKGGVDPNVFAAKMRTPLPSATGKTTGPCPGYLADLLCRFKHGESDAPENMQWQTVLGCEGEGPHRIAKCLPILTDIVALSHVSPTSTLPPNPRWLLEPTQQKGHPCEPPGGSRRSN
jgi:hypothetical protein